MASQTQEESNEPIEVTILREDIARYYGVEPSEVEARAHELSLPDDLRLAIEKLYHRKIVGFLGGQNANAFNGVILPTAQTLSMWQATQLSR
jgi:hypothetical protein